MWLARLVNQSFLSEYPVKVINNGIDLDMFKPTKSKFRDDYCLNNKFIILGVANVWNNKKGLNDFIKLSRLTNSHYVIVLVGISERQLQKLPKNIVGIPKTNSVKELAEIYSAADVFINPTYEDNFPTTNLESLACGTPVITYDTGGSPEAIDYASGYVVKKGDVEGIHNLLKVLKDNDYRSEDYLTRAKLFDKKRMLSEYHNIYSRVELK
jgi:glycosyltransferase involved in cell wall biosynthesis